MLSDAIPHDSTLQTLILSGRRQGDPSFRIEHAAENPFREQQADRGRKQYEEGPGNQNDSSWVAALLALRPTPCEQRGDLENQPSRRVFLHFSGIFFAHGISSASSDARQCLRFRNEYVLGNSPVTPTVYRLKSSHTAGVVSGSSFSDPHRQRQPRR